MKDKIIQYLRQHLFDGKAKVLCGYPAKQRHTCRGREVGNLLRLKNNTSRWIVCLQNELTDVPEELTVFEFDEFFLRD